MALSAAGIVCTLAAALTVLSSPASADSVVVTVLDRDGKPVPGVAVFLESPELAARPVLQPSAVMDQHDKRFVPHLLVVQAGTSVEFPNSDTIAHHVYSFSYPNEFKLPIYKGDAYPPISFADSGVVILGCNVHDNMLGYILVVDTPVFAKTDAEGHAHARSRAVERCANLGMESTHTRRHRRPVHQRCIYRHTDATDGAGLPRRSGRHTTTNRNL